MKLNMGQADRIARIAIAGLLAYLAFGAGVLTGVLFWIGLAVALVFAVTAVFGNCPLYALIGLKTCREC